MFLIYFNIFFDFSRKCQCLFQDPATSIMENIIDLHHDISFFLVVIVFFVLFLLARVFFFFNSNNIQVIRSLYLTHNTTIEII